MLSVIKQTLSECGVKRGAHILSACSGGPDSVAMTDMLVHLQTKLGIRVSVAHVDHDLRAGSAQEQAQVKSLCNSRWQVSFIGLKVKVSGSLQQGARRARYDALLSSARDCNAQFVAVGHTQDDQAETVLDRLMRGAGLPGLAGIKLVREDGVIRPVLRVTRVELQSHLKRFEGLPVVKDPSNHNRDFLRVRIRQQLLPLLKEDSPTIVRHLCNVANDAQALNAHLEDEAEQLLQACQDSADRLLLNPIPLKQASRPIRRAALRRWLAPVCQLKRAQQEEIEGLLLANNDKAQVLLADDHIVQLCDERLCLLTRQSS